MGSDEGHVVGGHARRHATKDASLDEPMCQARREEGERELRVLACRQLCNGKRFG